MNTDSAYCAGTNHLGCEDYARSGVFQKEGSDKAYAILSDGCSSSDDSDLGARFAVLSAENLIKLMSGEFDSFLFSIALQAWSIIESRSLPIDVLDATLFSICVDDKISFDCLGDGYLITKTKTGKIEILSFVYPNGYPAYLSYLIAIGKQTSFIQLDGQCIQTHIVISPDGEESREQKEFSGLIPTSFGIPDIENYEWVAITSDGIDSFYRTETTETSKKNIWIEKEQFLLEMLEFKTFAGKFVKRRMSAFLKKKEKEGWRHSDDLSLAVVYLGAS